MRNENLDDKGQFKMRLDEEEAEEAPITADVGDLRLEKLNTRVTLISILIPVLIVVVLVIAYLDIKKRVIKTEDTGQLTAESLSKELESRFSSLTMAQKVVEENLERLKDQSNKSVAKVQINLKKLDDQLKKLDGQLKKTGKTMASQKDIKATKSKLDQSVNNVAQSIEELRLQLGEINQTLQPRISNLEKILADNKTGMTQLEEQLSVLDANKVDKAKMDVALKLEMLKIKQAYKSQLEDLQSRLKSVEAKDAQKAAQSAVKPPASSTTTKSATTPDPVPSSPAPSSPAPLPGQLEEQTIGK